MDDRDFSDMLLSGPDPWELSGKPDDDGWYLLDAVWPEVGEVVETKVHFFDSESPTKVMKLKRESGSSRYWLLPDGSERAKHKPTHWRRCQ